MRVYIHFYGTVVSKIVDIKRRWHYKFTWGHFITFCGGQIPKTEQNFSWWMKKFKSNVDTVSSFWSRSRIDEYPERDSWKHLYTFYDQPQLGVRSPLFRKFWCLCAEGFFGCWIVYLFFLCYKFNGRKITRRRDTRVFGMKDPASNSVLELVLQKPTGILGSTLQFFASSINCVWAVNSWMKLKNFAFLPQANII